MTEDYKYADAVITIEGKEYTLFKVGPLSKYPYMVDVSIGGIPYREQRSLLKRFLIQNGVDIEPWEEKQTHWCVRQAIYIAKNGRLAQDAVSNKSISSKDSDSLVQKKYLPLTPESIEQVSKHVLEVSEYGSNFAIIHDVLKRFSITINIQRIFIYFFIVSNQSFEANTYQMFIYKRVINDCGYVISEYQCKSGAGATQYPPFLFSRKK